MEGIILPQHVCDEIDGACAKNVRAAKKGLALPAWATVSAFVNILLPALVQLATELGPLLTTKPTVTQIVDKLYAVYGSGATVPVDPAPA